MAFEKGKSGNPSGGRKQKKAHDALVLLLKADGEDMPRLRKIWDAIVTKAEGGDAPCAKEVFDRLDGKVPQAIVGDSGEDPIMLARIERVIVKPAD